jgi:bacteriorhodopsin
MLNFLSLTGISMVMGYDRYVDWLISTAMDLLLLNHLQFYRDLKKFWKTFRRTYRGMAKIIGIRVFHK